VLFLDEPTAALDPAATRAIEEMINACHADGMTILMTTHDLGQARRLADGIFSCIMDACWKMYRPPVFQRASRGGSAGLPARGPLW
jgi:tungstate transport system ATP-binding protein